MQWNSKQQKQKKLVVSKDLWLKIHLNFIASKRKQKKNHSNNELWIEVTIFLEQIFVFSLNDKFKVYVFSCYMEKYGKWKFISFYKIWIERQFIIVSMMKIYLFLTVSECECVCVCIQEDPCYEFFFERKWNDWNIIQITII